MILGNAIKILIQFLFIHSATINLMSSMWQKELHVLGCNFGPKSCAHGSDILEAPQSESEPLGHF